MTSSQQARAVRPTARAVSFPAAWLLLFLLVASLATLAGCAGQRKAIEDLKRCSSRVSLDGYREVASYVDRASWNVAYVGTPEADPMQLLTGDAADVSLVDEMPDGPFTVIGQGKVNGAEVCKFFIKRWNKLTGPTVLVQVDQATLENIESGREQLLLLSFISVSDKK
ncbi:hypothetical protein [Micromonospora foliorum]|uniref:hypothetical protein n=1 Tax=Micromonospora foliorum TaxID=2911210 RepID=UPI001EE942FF|nr:hypothetical protein [Micromonospora foliorum]MCG5434579.1 hypothetical protein [Micromonospora foliorum]